MCAAAKVELTAFLAKGTKFKGELRFSGIVRVDGIFEGKIFSDGTLVVGQTGIVKGEVKVGELMVNGLVDGTIEATKSIEVSGSGKLLGHVLAPSLNVSDGVLVEAEVHIGTPSARLKPEG